MNTTVTVGDPPMGQLVGSTDKTKAGWMLGGGAEYALCNNITLKAEAMWFDLGSISLNASIPNFNSSLDVRSGWKVSSRALASATSSEALHVGYGWSLNIARLQPNSSSSTSGSLAASNVHRD